MRNIYFLIALLFLSIKIFAQPAIAFQKTIGGSANDFASCMSLTKDGGVILGGASYSDISSEKTENSIGEADYWIVRLDSSGKILWDKTIGSVGDDQLTAVLQTKDGGYILGGYSQGRRSGQKSQGSRGSYDYWVVKLDSLHNIQWDKTIGGNKGDFLTALCQTDDGNYILGGYSRSDIFADKTDSNRGNYDYWIVKLDSAGNKKWDKTIGGKNADQLECLQQTKDGGLIIGGYSISKKSGEKTQNSRGGYDYWVVKLNTAGAIEWDKTVGGNMDDEFTSVKQTNDGGYILGGTSSSSVSGERTESNRGIYDMWIVKLDNKGNVQWDKSIGGSLIDACNSLQQTSDGGFILGGDSQSSISGEKTENAYNPNDGYDYWIVKLDKNHNIEWDKTIGGYDGEILSSIAEVKNNNYIFTGYSFSGHSFDKTGANRGLPFCDYWFVKLKYQPAVDFGYAFFNIAKQNLNPF